MRLLIASLLIFVSSPAVHGQNIIGFYDASQALGVIPFRSVNTLPTSCRWLEVVTLTSTSPAQNYQCDMNNSWHAIGSGGGGGATVSGSAVLKGYNGNAVAASASDVVSLFSSCSGTKYLGADNACHTPPGTSTTIRGQTALSTTQIPAGQCGTTQTVSAVGTVASGLTPSVVTFSFASDPSVVAGYTPGSADGINVAGWPSTDAVNFRQCNPTTNAITPGAISVNWISQ